jgi:nitronate monooxygenase
MVQRSLRLGHSIEIERPIMQAPIGSLASTDLVAAVSNAGGLGCLALTWTGADAARRLVTEVKARTARAFAANFVLAFEPMALNTALEAGVPVVTFSWGLPGHLVRTVRSFGAAVGVQVGAVEGAKRALQEGCDFIVCQGSEAGGHVQSSTPLHELLPAVVAEARGVPIFAAGGLADGNDIADVMLLGASAVMMGTRFVASSESYAHPDYKAALLAASAQDTVLTACFDGGWPHALHRVLRNTTLRNWEAMGCPPPGRRPGEGETAAEQKSGEPIVRYDDTPPNIEMTGEILSCCLYAGTGVTKIIEIQCAEVLVKGLWNVATGILGRIPDATTWR